MSNVFVLLRASDDNEPWQTSVVNEQGLANWFAGRAAYEPDWPCKVLWADKHGNLLDVHIDWTSTNYDANDWATVTGIMSAAAGAYQLGTFSYPVDGRS